MYYAPTPLFLPSPPHTHRTPLVPARSIFLQSGSPPASPCRRQVTSSHLYSDSPIRSLLLLLPSPLPSSFSPLYPVLAHGKILSHLSSSLPSSLLSSPLTSHPCSSLFFRGKCLDNPAARGPPRLQLPVKTNTSFPAMASTAKSSRPTSAATWVTMPWYGLASMRCVSTSSRRQIRPLLLQRW